MTSRAFLFLFLLTGFTLAQIDMYPEGAAALEKKFNSTAGIDTRYVSGGLVTVSELSVPAKARNEFSKSLESLRKQNFTRALQELKRALAIDPAFPGAYNNLGVVYAHLGDTQQEREALEKAVACNDHFKLAYLNLARLDMVSSDFIDADIALRKVAALDPGDPTPLFLLAYSEMMQGNLSESIATANQAHALNQPHAFAHRVAARVFERQRQFDRAMAELKMFLEEEPTSPSAADVRKELEIVQRLQ